MQYKYQTIHEIINVKDQQHQHNTIKGTPGEVTNPRVNDKFKITNGLHKYKRIHCHKPDSSKYK